jgi:hypothetical protein
MSTIEEKDYKYILENHHGNIDEGTPLDAMTLSKFCKLGYITMGVDNNFNDRWMITPLGQRKAESFLETRVVNEKLELLLDLFEV